MLRILPFALLAACGGSSGGAGSTCNATADCDTGLDCAGPDDPAVCGIAPRQECQSDTDCQVVDTYCHVIADSCSPDGVGSECRPACTGDAACGTGFRCDANHCIAIACDAGFACADREACDPSRITNATPIYDRHHGCFAVACTTDAICDAGACVNGTCQDGLGTCEKPMLVP